MFKEFIIIVCACGVGNAISGFRKIFPMEQDLIDSLQCSNNKYWVPLGTRQLEDQDLFVLPHLIEVDNIDKDCDNEKLETDLINISQKFKNITIFRWDLSQGCQPLSKIIPRFKNLEKLSLITSVTDIPTCQEFRFNFENRIKEMEITLRYLCNKGLKQELKVPNDSYIDKMENLEILKMNCLKNNNKDCSWYNSIPSAQLQSMTNLWKLEIKDCYDLDLIDTHLNHLVSLENLTLINTWFNKPNWLESTVVQNSLKYLYASTWPNYKQYNISAFICGQYQDNCTLNYDINKRPCPESCECFLKISEDRFYIKCDQANEHNQIPELPIPITGKASLHFNNTNLTSMPNSSLYGYSNLRELHLANNQISHLNIENLPINLTYLDIRNNSIKAFDKNVIKFLTKRAGNIKILLDENPWTCDCKDLSFQLFVANESNNIRENLMCHRQDISLVVFLGQCDSPYDLAIIGILCGFIVIIFTYMRFKKPFVLWLYKQKILEDPTIAQNIDVFLAYSHLDSGLAGEFVERVERGPSAHKLCLYERDWDIGVCITQCILQTMEDARSIIILLTKNFVKSSWGTFEFRSSIHAAAIDKRKKLIVVLYPEVDTNELDSELRVYLKFKKYLKRDDENFWKKLLAALPVKAKQAANPEKV